MFVNYSLETTQNIPETIVLNLDYHGSISNVVCDCDLRCHNYDDVIIGAMASQITSLTIVYSAVYSDADQTKHQSSAPLAVVRGIHRGPMNSQHQWPVTRKMFPFDDVIRILSHIWRLHMLWCCMGTESFETIRRSVSWIWLVLANGQVQVHGAVSWWRHQMETFSALLALCVGNSSFIGEFPSQRPVTRRFGVFCDLRLNKQLSKQSWGWWFEAPLRSLWRHRSVV